jgi:cellulose synthase/poly-beta-1,6-N-acetylglucosamine synthase-like glycosyltransferase
LTTLASDVISITLLIVLLVWSVYNGSIIYVGIKHKREQERLKKVKQEQAFFGTELSYSIIIPTKNEESVIRRCLNGILSIDYPKDKMQVIVVDGNSTDNTRKICREFEEKYPRPLRLYLNRLHVENPQRST